MNDLECTSPPSAESKTVLFISYWFPPLSSSGVFRSQGFATHLREFGWRPEVLTVKKSKDAWSFGKGEVIPAGIQIHRTLEINVGWLPDILQSIYQKFRKLFGLSVSRNPFRDIFCMPDAQIGWLFFFRGLRLARQADCLYVSCSPFSTGLIASFLKKLTGKPLVVDFRDAWMAHPERLHWGFAITNHIRQGIERLIVSEADRLILNTEDSLDTYRQAYPRHSARMLCIPNGFDELNLPKSVPNNEKMRIVHIGSFYGERTPTLLLKSLLQCNKPTDFEFVHVGPLCDELDEYESRLTILQTGPMTRGKALEWMRNADVLYLKQAFVEAGKRSTAVAAKTHEYLTTGLPMLVEVPEGNNLDIVKKYAPNARIISSYSEPEMIAALEELLESKGQETPDVSPEYIEDYSRRKFTRRLAEILADVSTE